ncbi:hypothetical protein I7I53_00289 [Histoplasma capsulatum var. duboisii H88]|uniref:Uncharacterized protein n=1 Tax=Ajellomyces capsulatus (strain H88) TaxID=544711 RepID=A0A8A1LGU0_AJEC8|nr:hypothetical protein I7I53_00289 [Histoplasma capsulatum var. duboisii H88]
MGSDWLCDPAFRSFSCIFLKRSGLSENTGWEICGVNRVWKSSRVSRRTPNRINVRGFLLHFDNVFTMCDIFPPKDKQYLETTETDWAP